MRRGLPPPIVLTIVTADIGPATETQAIPDPGLLIQAVNGTGPFTWELVSPPTGWTSGPEISGTTRNARILGTPPADGTVTLTVKVTDSLGATDTKPVNLEVSPFVPILNITTTTFASSAMIATQEIVAPGLLVHADNGTGPFLWEKISGPAWGTISGTTRNARLNGTPPAAGPVTFEFKVTDSLGQTDQQIVTGTIDAAPASLNITTTTFGDLTEDQSVGTPGLAVQTQNGTGPYVWEKIGTAPGWATVEDIATTPGRVTGTPPNVGESFSITVKVTDSLGATDTQTITFSVIAESDPGDPLYYRQIGVTKNIATDAQMKIFYDEVFAGSGQDRIIGGLVRYDLGGNVWGGSNVTAMKGDIQTRMNKIVNEGQMFSAPIIGYTMNSEQRRIVFQGRILTGHNVGWINEAGTGYDVGWNLQDQMGDAGRTINSVSHPARRPTSANGYYRGPIGAGKLGGDGFYGTGNGVGVSCHGPGIPYIKDQDVTLSMATNTGTASSGTTVITCSMPTGNNPGANVPDSVWIGQKVQCSGLQPGAKITAKVDATHWRVDKQATANGARVAIIGRDLGADADAPKPYACTTQESGALVFGTEGGNTAAGDFTIGATGTYYLGGTNSGQDIKIWYDDPLDFERLAANITTASNGTTKRVKRIEMWNEMSWAMGCRPTVDIARAARMMCHAFVGVKKIDPSITVCFPGPGDIVNSVPNFLNAPDYIEALLNFWYNVDPNYFSDLKTARGVTKLHATRVPCDEVGIHPYTNTPLAANDESMGQLVDMYNLIGDATGGDYLPMAPTEQGPGWTRSGGAGVLTGPGGYTAMKAYIDVFHGNVPWAHTKHFNADSPGANVHLPTYPGSGPTAGYITLTARRNAMAQVISCATFFAIREPPGSSAPYGIMWDASTSVPGGVQKYYPGGSTNDPLKAIADA
jgi:hypothetical protein